MRLALRKRITAHDHPSAAAEGEVLEQWLRQPTRLVGHNPPVDSPRIETLESFCNTFVDPRFHGQSPAVDFKKAGAQSREYGLGNPGEAETDQGGRAVRYEPANALERERLTPLLLQQLIQGARHVRCRVEKRAVKIKQHGARAFQQSTR
jgi:hypothetical protein